MYIVKQSTALTVPIFVHDAAGDAVTGLVDGGFTKRISKGSGAFAAMTVTITEMENGFYSVPISTSHSDTLGLLTMLFTSTAKQVNLQFRVEAKLNDDLNDIAATDIVSAGAITTLSGAIVNVDLVDTLTTYTGNTLQTGDSFARLGAPSGASVSADIADLPTNTELNARTILSADYFDPAVDPVATVTTLTNLPAITTNWLTATGIAANAFTAAKFAASSLDGKGDWNTVVPDAAGVVPTAIENADAYLDRDMSVGTDSGSSTFRTPRQALRFLRNHWDIVGTTLTVRKEDDSTTSWTGVVVTDAAADPVTGSNPAGGS